MQSFWQPQSTPNTEIRLDKPSMEVPCPATGKKLNIKSLIDIKFHAAPEGSEGHHIDPISNDIITNHAKLVVLAPTGDVVLEKTYLTCIKPDGEYDGTLPAHLSAGLLCSLSAAKQGMCVQANGELHHCTCTVGPSC